MKDNKIDLVEALKRKRGIADKLEINDLEDFDIERDEFTVCKGEGSKQKNRDEDYDYMRETLRYAIDSSKAVLKEVMLELKLEKNPMTGNVCVQLLKGMNETVGNLTSMHKDYTKIELDEAKSKREDDPLEDDETEGKRLSKISATVSEIVAAKKKAEKDLENGSQGK